MEVSRKADRRLGRVATTAYLGLAAFVSAVLMLAPPCAPAQCTNVAGNWIYSESGTVTLTLTASDGESANETDPVSGNGNVTVTQTGPCAFRYIPIPLNGSSLLDVNLTPSQLASLARTVTVSGNNVDVTGIFVLVDTAKAAQLGLTITSISPNVYTATGQVTTNVVDATTISLNGTGNVIVTGTGSFNGQNISFTLTITASSTVTMTTNGLLPTAALSVSKSGNGTVNSVDGYINCGAGCSSNYVTGSVITLTATPAQGWVFAGWSGCDSTAGNICILTMNSTRSVTAFFSSGSSGLRFVPVTPCRVADTRNATSTFGGPSIVGNTPRNFPISQSTCNIPSTALAYSLNFTVIPQGSLGYLTVWPAGLNQPVVSTLNSYDGRVKANASIMPAGDNGEITVYAADTTDLIIDINGYFESASNTAALAFYPLTPCRVLDTRKLNGDLGGPFLNGGQERDFQVLESTCIPSNANAVAYSMNFTVVPYNGQPLGYLTVWPSGESQPLVSTLNNLTGTIVANAAIVPAGTGGEISVFPSNNTDLVGDIDGYFAAAGQGGLSLYPAVPCRVLDTRKGNGAFSGELTVNVVGSTCASPSTAEAYVLNATAVPVGSLGYLTLWPDGESQPVVSTLNAIDGAITSNMAIVPTVNGLIDAFAAGTTQLILDISSYFAP